MKQFFAATLRKLESRFFEHVNLTVSSCLDGKRYRIPIVAGLGRSNRVLSDPWMYSLLKELTRLSAGTFVDVGVNLGQTLIKLKCADPVRPYVGFEPNPTCVAYVRHLIRKNRYTQAVILPIALFERDGILSLDFFAEDDVDSSASLISNFRPGERIITSEYVAAFTFSTLAQSLSIGAVGIVKIDVEGAELEVVGTLQALLAEFRPFVLIEILPVYSRDNYRRLERQQKLELIFSVLGYKWCRVEKTARDEYDGLSEISSIGVHSDIRKCDYLVVPAELSTKVTAKSPRRETPYT